MADKKHKKPKHTNLVVPGDKKRKKVKKDRLGRMLPADEGVAGPAKQAGEDPAVRAPEGPKGQAMDVAAGSGAAEGQVKGPEGKKGKPSFFERVFPGLATAEKKEAGTPGAADAVGEELPPNAVRLPKKRKGRLTPAKRRRRRRRIAALALAVLVLFGVLFYTTGTYMTVAIRLSDLYDGLRIAARPGDGFPMDFVMNGYVKAEAMGNNGFAVLGAREAAIVSSTGQELWRVHHSYLYPGLSAGKTRVVVYSRGGKEYTVEGRSKTMTQVETGQDILFCAMSPDGWLAVVTSSRHRATLNIYGPSYDTSDPLLHWAMKDTDGLPHLLRFHNDNRSVVLGCLMAKDGAMGSVLYLLRTDRSEPVAVITAEDAMLVRADYLANRRILAVYDRYTVLYNQNGEELARYSYGGRRLLTADVQDGRAALVFGTTAQDKVHLVYLNDGLEPVFDKALEVSGTPAVLAGEAGLFLLAGQKVTALHADGSFAEAQSFEAKALGLVAGGQPLALLAGRVVPLEGMLAPPEEAAGSGQDASAPGSLASGLQGAEPPGQAGAMPDGVPDSLPASKEPSSGGDPEE